MDTIRAGLLYILLTTAFPSFSDDGHRVLFKSNAASVPKRDQRVIYSLMKLSLAKDKSGFMLDDVCPPVSFDVEVTDLNGDGIPEVFLLGGNTCTSGATGSSVWLFAKGKGGAYRMNLGFPSAGYKILSQTVKGYPNIQFGGPGFCEAVWSWNGKHYVHLKNVPTSPGGCNDG